MWWRQDYLTMSLTMSSLQSDNNYSYNYEDELVIFFFFFLLRTLCCVFKARNVNIFVSFLDNLVWIILWLCAELVLRPASIHVLDGCTIHVVHPWQTIVRPLLFWVLTKNKLVSLNAGVGFQATNLTGLALICAHFVGLRLLFLLSYWGLILPSLWLLWKVL